MNKYRIERLSMSGGLEHYDLLISEAATRGVL